MTVIVRKDSGAYPGPVAALFRLLAIAAMILMPFGVGMGPAAAHQSVMSMPADGHCDQGPSNDEGKAKMAMQCAAACTALPAQPSLVRSPQLLPAAPLVARPVSFLTGAAPPPATPPPKLG